MMCRASHDGGVELLDLVPQSPRLLLHLAALLLQLGDVLHCLLQRDGMAGLQTGVGSEQRPRPRTEFLTQCPQAAYQLGIIRDQTVQGVKAHLDVEAPLLLG